MTSMLNLQMKGLGASARRACGARASGACPSASLSSLRPFRLSLSTRSQTQLRWSPVPGDVVNARRVRDRTRRRPGLRGLRCALATGGKSQQERCSVSARLLDNHDAAVLRHDVLRP